MAIQDQIDLNKMAPELRSMRNPATGNTIADDVKAGYGAARDRLVKKAVVQGGLTPFEANVVQQGTRPGDVNPLNLNNNMQEVSYGARKSAPQATAAPVDVAQAPQSQPVAAENVAVNTPSSNGSAFVSNGTTNSMPSDQTQSGVISSPLNSGQDLSPGNGYIKMNGKTIPVGGARRQGSISAPAAPVQSPFGARATELLAEEKRLMDDPNGSIGNGIVARGAANRAKVMQELDAQSRGLDIQQQNADTSAFGARSQAADRLRTNARQDLATLTDVKGKELEQAQIERVNKLQEQYMAETDPAKKAAIQAQLTAFTGKSADKYQPITGKDDTGNPMYLGAFDQRTGTFRPQSQLADAGQAAAPAGMRQIGTSGGKPVYEDAQGNRFTL